MSVKIECDRCGAQEQTSGVMLFAGTCGPGIPTARPGLPDGWTRPRLPNEDGSADHRELCPDCKRALLLFMTGAPLVAEKSGQPVPDLGTGARPAQDCPDCGHLRHSGPCPDEVAEVGPCGCMRLASRELMKELGIND